MRVLISGINGQDGSYLRDSLELKKFDVYGIQSTGVNTFQFVCANQSDIIGYKNFSFMKLEDIPGSDFVRALDIIQPDYIFHLATIHSSSQQAKNFNTLKKTQMDLVNIEMSKQFIKWCEKYINSRLFLALSSKMYSPKRNRITAITENSMRFPQDYYSITKSISWDLARKSREEVGTKISTGILFNHSSPRSKSDFIIPNIAQQINDFAHLKRDNLEINDFESLIDLTHAREVSQCIFEIVEKYPSTDFVIGANHLISIKDIVYQALTELRLPKTPVLKSIVNQKNKGFIVSDTTKVFDLVGWRPIIPPYKILLEIVQALK